MRDYISSIDVLKQSDRIKHLKTKMINEKRYASIEQALIITRIYQENEDKSIKIKRALSLNAALDQIRIRVDKGELIVGNRTANVRTGVIFPESGLSWVDDEIEHLHERSQDRFYVRKKDVHIFRNEILPYWQGKTLEDMVDKKIGEDISKIGKVAKINQTDHAQGHICPNTAEWLALGPAGLLDRVKTHQSSCSMDKVEFYEAVLIVLKGALRFIERYENLANELADAETDKKAKEEYLDIARTCNVLKRKPASTLREAVQSLWFLYVILQMESNASSFSPGRADQYLYPYFIREMKNGTITYAEALDLIEALWLKFNQIVYLRSSNSSKYFAGFPIGFNVALGGITKDGQDASNELSFIFLKAQEHLGLPQPNLSARIFKNTPGDLLTAIASVIGKGGGMPQVFNDEAIIPALMNQCIAKQDAENYAIVGCVELTTHGNSLGWSDAAMFNLVKALELALNDGACMLTGNKMGAKTGTLADFKTYEDVEAAFDKQIDFFFDRMLYCCEVVEKLHAQILPSAFLSAVINDCIMKGVDVTEGGAHYNLSGIQAIQLANIADSLAAIKMLVFEKQIVSRQALHCALCNNYEDDEPLRLTMLNHAPKYGNDVEWVDNIGAKWIRHFTEKFHGKTNMRGGPYHTGLYTVSAHVPMGANVGATPDGRKAKQPLADGGMSAVYGRDTSGPTALLKSVSRIDSMLGSNGTLLNMKFQPSLFEDTKGLEKFVAMLRTFIDLKISHVQFNVVNKEDLLSALSHPEAYKSLTIRVAGYTAYFTELEPDLQKEIIARTWQNDE